MTVDQQDLATRDRVRHAVATLLGEPVEDIGDHDDLVELGLDSLGIMTLATRWRSDGATVGFADLVAEPTVACWSARLDAPVDRPAPVDPATVLPVDGDPVTHDLAPMQLAYWAGRRPGMPLGAPSSHFYFEFDGRGVDRDRLDAAVRAVTARHGMLRARIGDDATQRVDPGTRGLGGVLDLRELDDPESRLADLRAALSHQRMDVAAGQVLDVRLTLLPGGRTRVHVDIDMIVCDAASFRIVLADLATCYAGRDPGPDPDPDAFGRYVTARRLRPVADADRAYWRDRIPTLPDAPRLPTATTPETVRDAVTVRRHHRLDPDRYRALATAARRAGVTPSMALATAYARIVARWSANERFLLTLPLFDRDTTLPGAPDVRGVVGDFTNLVLLEIDGGAVGDGSFAAAARGVQDRFRSDAAHTGYPGTEVLRELVATRGDGSAPAPVVFTSALSMGELFGPDVTGALGDPTWMSSQTAGVWIDLQVVEDSGGVLLNWEQVDELFCDGVGEAMFTAFVDLVERLCATGWDAPLHPALPADQCDARVVANATGRAFPPGTHRTLHGAFFARAAATPHAPAVVHPATGGLSYGELADRALRLAAALRARGLAAGEPVVVGLPKGPDQVVAVLGVLAAGGAYVPVGLHQPPARRAAIHRRCGARLAVTGPGGDRPESLVTVDLDDLGAVAPAAGPAGVPERRTAYVIYTSGSTGEPKGVRVSHAAATNTIVALNERFDVGPADRTLALSALDFDLSVYDVFGPLSAGGAVVCVDESERRDAARWVEIALASGATILNCVPALLDMLLVAHDQAGGPWGLRLLLLGGDWVGLDLPGRVHGRAPDCRFVALGGTTETAIHSTVCEVGAVPPDWRSIPYGVPLPNQTCRVVDERWRDRPDWVPGELWIGGAGVADGYDRDPDRTADRFPTVGGRRWYRTGDLARYRPGGTLEFLGRADFQVKINGYRVELGEIEVALRSGAGVQAGVACTVGDAHPRLAAMVAGADVDPEQVRAAVAERVPDYMVPAQVVVVDELPLSANGKIDRAAVATAVAGHGGAAPAAGDEPPHGPAEQAVAALWAELLVLDGRLPGRHDSFFALGGDSLLATRLVTRLEAVGLHGGGLGQLFSHPTLSGFAGCLTPGEAVRAVLVEPDQDARHDPFPPTEVQRAYWTGRDPEYPLGGVGSYWYWEFDGADVDLARLSAAWDRLVARHEMLRAVFDDDGHQRILAEVGAHPWPVSDAAPGREFAALQELRDAMSHRLFDTATWPLFDVRAVRYGDGRTRVAFGFDYIVLDALSIMILFWELSLLYRDPDAALPPLGMSFRDYVLQVRTDPDVRAADERYWREQIESMPRAPELPLAVDPATIRAPRFTRREVRVEPAVWRALCVRAAEHAITPSCVLATAFAEVLARWAATPEVALNVTTFDRREVHPDVHNVVGDFTNLLLVGHRSAPGRTWADTTRALQEQLWTGLAHNSVSAVWVQREMARRDGTFDALVPVVFTSTLGVSDKLADLDIPFGRYVHGLSQTPQVVLDCQVVERDGTVTINWDAIEELFADGVLDAMFGAYGQLVDRLAAADWTRPVPVGLPGGQRAERDAANATAAPQSGRLLHEAFFARAAAEPDGVALRHGADVVSAGDLADRALRVAAALDRAGVAAGEPVAVCLPKGVDQVVAVLGVLAAGGFYVPVGVDQPPARRNRILARAGVGAVLAGPDAPSGLDPLVRVLDVAAAADPVTGPTPRDRPVPVDRDDPAYVIFTSGSTGEPKGVEVSHAAAVNTCDDVTARYGIGPRDVGLALSALDFDLSVYDLFGLLSAGASLVLVDEAERREARRWAELVTEHGVTVWNTVPALLDMLLTAGGDDLAPGSLRVALVSGDWVGLDLPDRFAAASPGGRLVALGGATEAAIWSNAFDVSAVDPAWRSVPYGYPLHNQRYRVVDVLGRDCPELVAGELWIGGAGLARGYRNDPERTAERFVTDDDGRRWYRTGDRGRYLPGAVLEFLGRDDGQVKVRGHRIELGEIEAALREHPDVDGAVALVVGERAAGRIVAAVTGTGEDQDATGVRDLAAALLPAHMVPERVLALEAFPLTPNGKVDRGAVAALSGGDPAAGEGDAPRTATERELAAIWTDLLDRPVRRTDSFFALGGDSLVATELVERIRTRLGVRLTLRQVFVAPLLADVAECVDRERDLTEEGEL